MDDEKQTPGVAGEPLQEALGRFLPVLTAGMTDGEAAGARETLIALFTLRAAETGGTAEDIDRRQKLASGLSLEGRRKMLQEDTLALEVERITREVSSTADRVLSGEVPVTGKLKKETRRTLARLGQLNAILVGRYPHLTPLLAKVSEAYLDAMFILGDGKGPMSNRLQGRKKEREPSGKGG